MTSWRLDPPVVVGIFGIGLVYVEATRRLKRIGAGFPRSRERCLLAGLAVVFLALDGPIDAGASGLLSVHMLQHMLLTMVAAPLIVLGAPVTLALRASSPGTRRRILVPILNSRMARIAANPLVAWSLLFVVLWASHLTSLYEAAMLNRGLHALEHVAYLATAVLFRSEEHTSELQSRPHLVCRLLLEKKKKKLTPSMVLKQKKKYRVQVKT